MRRAALRVLPAAAALALSGCSSNASQEGPSVGAARDVAQHFAQAILGGDADTALALLVHPADPALSSVAMRAADAWKQDTGAVRLPGARSGRRWVFAYEGRRTHDDGRFEDVRGELVVVLSASGEAAVQFFTFRNQAVRFSTHHDSLLLPSNR